MNPTEHQIQTSIISYLFMKGYYAMRLNSGRVPVINKYGSKHMMQLMPAGTPDIMAFKGYAGTPTMSLLFIEVKRPGKKPTYLQEAKMKELEQFGAKCFIATSIDDVEKVLNG